MKIHLTPKSSNAKTGPIPVTTSSSKTCPSVCPFNHRNSGGCYADSGPLALHWRAVSSGERGGELAELTKSIREFPAAQLWRHNQAGDLPGVGNKINQRQLSAIVSANEGRRGFTYTHKPLTVANRAAIESANRKGFTVNVSTNSVSHADQVKKGGIKAPIVCVVPSTETRKVFKSPAGNPVIVCPATYRNTDCASCGACQVASRKSIIAFPAHGTGKRRVDAILSKGGES